jgi:hypothetical protein
LVAGLAHIFAPMSDLELHLHEPRDEADADNAKLTEDADLRWLVGDPRGRRIARRLLERSGIWRPSFTGDALNTAFREGERNVGLRFTAVLLRAAPEAAARIIAGQDGR